MPQQQTCTLVEAQERLPADLGNFFGRFEAYTLVIKSVNCAFIARRNASRKFAKAATVSLK